MAALPTTALTLVDWGKRLDPNGNTADIIEILNQTNELLADMSFIEGNLPTGHQTTVRTGLPAVFWRMLNRGVPTSKSHTAQITEQTGMLEAYSSVDRDLAQLGGDVNGVRMSEAKAFLEAMNQEMAQTVFYGSSIAPEEFIGLSPRYSSTAAGNGSNILKGGAVGPLDSTSVWLLAWSPETLTGIFPRGSKAGIYHEDLGLETAENANGEVGTLMRVYRDHWQWKAGIALKDWRYAVRIANIDVSDLLAGNAQAAALSKLMADAEELIPNELGRRVFYMNRTVRRMLRHQTTAAVSVGGGITFENFGGKRIAMFGTTPIRIVDALTNNEDIVV